MFEFVLSIVLFVGFSLFGVIGFVLAKRNYVEKDGK
jgi:uncharacterized membrane protein